MMKARSDREGDGEHWRFFVRQLRKKNNDSVRYGLLCEGKGWSDNGDSWAAVSVTLGFLVNKYYVFTHIIYEIKYL